MTFALRVVGSAVAQAWVGDSVRGAAEFEDCTIVQFWNGSPVFEAKASADCRVISAFGLQVPADQGNDAFELRQLDDHATLVEMGRRMDYNRASTAAVDDKQGDA